VTLDTDGRGKLFTKCQVTDYRLRGEALASWNVIEYFVDSYETNMDSKLKAGNAGSGRLDAEEQDLE
jgi:hypothetical protein